MRIVISSLLFAALAAPLAATGALAGPNVPLCLAIETNYNNCINQQQRARAGWGGPGGGYGGGGWGGQGGGYGGGGYGGGGYGGGGGWGGPRGGVNRGAQAQQACMAWLVQLQANHCF